MRDSYHHGDLRAALVEAGAAAARTGGEQAVRLTRLAAEVGVSASAAYRHFPNGLEDLLVAVGDVGRTELAAHLERRVAEVPQRRDPARRAAERFRASGLAYVEYVSANAGLFEVACRHARGRLEGADAHALLERYLDDLVTAGVLPAARRPDASVAAWAAVHGLALLIAEGALGRVPEPVRRRMVDRTLDMVERGL